MSGKTGRNSCKFCSRIAFLIAINATLEVTEIVLPAGEWHAIPPFAGEDNPVITAVWQGPAHGLCVFQR
ncbi:hypothetical protein OHD60_14280 [Escherichia coli]|nr:hypothetical protein [Escherichia coli]